MAIVPGLWPGSARLMVLEARQCPSRSPDGFGVDNSRFWKACPYPLVIFYADIGIFYRVFLPELPLDTEERGCAAAEPFCSGCCVRARRALARGRFVFAAKPDLDAALA